MCFVMENSLPLPIFLLGFTLYTRQRGFSTASHFRLVVLYF